MPSLGTHEQAAGVHRLIDELPHQPTGTISPRTTHSVKSFDQVLQGRHAADYPALF